MCIFLAVGTHFYTLGNTSCKNITYVLNVSIGFTGLAVRVFAKDPGNRGSNPGQDIPKTQKMVLDASLLNTQHYKVWIKCKWNNLGKGVAPSPTPWCSTY